ncbi:hypothetical protein UFOVP413_47 [uncultured Caudovirales phage]|uniref:Uncharacterized protein n=1 Tax=uncultured Caudovirales phage TaxID=2100421 RepID=A0A6J5M7L2_9CAUD|nr:hypothetical protein UFOVP413_47 [uncultured Caudovirales phage]
MTPTINPQQIIAELERQISDRRRDYSSAVWKNKMRQSEADYRIRLLSAAVDFIKKHHQPTNHP